MYLRFSDNLKINPNGFATLDSKEVWGALRGLETFSQLIYTNDDGAVSVSDVQSFKAYFQLFFFIHNLNVQKLFIFFPTNLV